MRGSSAESGRGAPPPAVRALRVIGPLAAPVAKKSRPPLGARLHTDEAGEGVLVTLREDDARDVATLAEALPDPATLAEGTWVVVPGDAAKAPSLTGRLFAALGRGATIPRALRCSALLVRGYDEVGGGLDPESGADLAWARTRARS